MDFVTSNKKISLITLIALLVAIIAAISIPKFTIPGTVKEITLNPLVRFLFYFAVAFLLLKVVAFAMVAALLAILATYLFELIWNTESFTNVYDGQQDQQLNNDIEQDVETNYIDDISEMSTGGRLKRSIDGTAVMGVTRGDGVDNMSFSMYSEKQGKEEKEGIVGYDASNKYASV